MRSRHASLARSMAALATALGVAWLVWWSPGDRLARATGSDAPDLAAAFTRAADAVRSRQHADGYWTTAVTLGPRFEHAVTEVNVFTPAMLVDLLDPVAARAGLRSALERARAYLGRQVERTGLVRYHGDPGPVPATHRGCELPPDADDTALVWRIAPLPDRALLRAAIREIERYRESGGLYRTWLADEQAYRCFYIRYAGREWNPPDVAVEMHVYLFLADHDAVAAGRLCQALARSIDEDRIWAWYTVAPLIPLLRTADLARKGCVVDVPRRRLETAGADQEIYLTQARLLGRLLGHGGSSDGGSAAPYVEALRAGAAGHFAALARTPPLLYHNDLSATPPHYHWSEEFGYALWLRLYAETARRFPGALPAHPPPAGAR